MKTKIYVACHKNSYVPENRLLYPIQVGCSNKKDYIDGMLHDDDGENISEKNPMYCELTAQYWAWKNDDADYYGLFHYRRYMNFSDQVYDTSLFEDVELESLDDSTMQKINLDADYMEQFIEKYDCIATSYTSIKRLNPIYKSLYHQYSVSEVQRKEDIDVLLDIIKEKYPEYYDIAYEYLHGECGYFCNMFIMKKELFHQYSQWLFDILDEHEKRRNGYIGYNSEEYRVSGYLGERLFGIFYTYLKKQGYRCTELQRTLFHNTNKPEVIEPYYKHDNIAIAFAANDYFAPWLFVSLKSMMNHISENRNYDVLIMSHDFSEKNQKIFIDEFQGERVHIRFIDPLRFMSVDHLFTRAHFSLETYYRLCLFKMLPNYSKVLYLDADLLFLDDVAKLYDIDLQDKWIAATYDADTAGLYNGAQKDRKTYTDSILKIKEPYNYFQAGVLLFNLEAFRQNFTMQSIMEYASSYNWQLLDQDILNNLCQGHVHYFPMEWNVMVDYAGIRIKQNISQAPYQLANMYMNSRRYPKIIHYAGPQKPWFEPEMDYGNEFWEVAKQTPYYEIIIYRMAHKDAYEEIKKISIGSVIYLNIRSVIKKMTSYIRRKVQHQIDLFQIRIAKK